MSGSHSNGPHEGWVAAVSPDGRGSIGARGAHMLLPGGDLLPNAEVVGWRAQCECGWVGPRWRRVTDPADHDLAAHRVFDREGGDPPVEVDDLAHQEWKAHVAPDETLAVLASAAAEARAARRRLDQAASCARAAGASWEAIGRAVGISRQSAHERWGEVGARGDALGMR